MKTINLLVAGLFAAVAPCAFAATLHSAEVDGVRWLYTERGGKAILGESLDSAAIIGDVPSKVVIPSAFGNTPVVSIGRYAFRNLKEITEVVIPDSVTTIEEQAFDGCNDSLFDTTTISGVRLVDGWAIDYTDSLSGNLDLSGVRGVASYAFRDCATISSVTIPIGLTRIETCAFLNCTNLASVTMPDSVVYIGQSAFSGCTALSKVKIPENVKNIDYHAFYGCSALTAVVIPDRTENIGDGAFNNCSELTNVTIPDSVTSIGAHAFRYCNDSLFDTTSFPGLVLVDGWVVDKTGSFTGHLDLSGSRGIASNVFRGSNGLSSITIPGSVAGISDHAFYGLTNLTSVILQDGVRSIGSYAFYNCTSLSEVRLSGTLTHIGSGAFGHCSGLTDIDIPNSVERIETYAFIGCSSLAKDGFVIVQDVVYDYYGSGGDVVIPDGVKTIGQQSFRGRLSIRHLVIPEGVTNIEEGAFCNCTNLASVVMPQSLLRIGEDAFDNCPSLTHITIPSGVKSIGSNAFGGCGGIIEFTVEEGNDSYKSVAGMLLTIDGKTLLAGVNGDVEIPVGVETIDEYAFSKRNKLASVTIPATVTFVGHYAFSGCNFAVVRFERQDGSIFVDSDAFRDVKSVEMVPDEGYEFSGWTGGNGTIMSPVWKPIVKIEDVSFRQRYPWNGLVDIDFTVKCVEPINITIFASAKDEASGKNLRMRKIWLEDDLTHTNALVVQRGTHRIVWDAHADLGQVIYNSVVVRVGCGDAHEKVQLWEGGPYWATTNIGAERPEDYGYYFWWGDTVGYRREDDNWVASDDPASFFLFDRSITPTYGKSIVSLQNEGWIMLEDGTNILAEEHDAAQVQWGGGWRMPTHQDFVDLCSGKCNWILTVHNGVKGYIVRGKGDYSSASIFLPIAGFGEGGVLGCIGSNAYYWSSVPYHSDSPYQSYTEYSYAFSAFPSYSLIGTSWNISRSFGIPIRPLQNYNGSMSFPEVVGCTGYSKPTMLDLRREMKVMSHSVSINIIYSPRYGWSDNCTIAVDGETVKTATDEGVFEWIPNGVGAHTLTHTAGNLVYTARFAVLGEDVAVHAGTLSTNETWGADKVHLVTAAVTVPSGVSLLIEPGAVVKFMPGTSLVVENNATCTAVGVVFTHANDDTMQGDTLFDGETAPVQDDYRITGNIIDDDTTEYRYMAPQELTSSITSNIRLRGHRVYVVSNDVTVANGATLTIQPGAILKFASGKSLTVNSGGTLNAQGTRALPIVFTSLKDDAHGGDTNGDGDNTQPEANDWRSIKVSGTATFAHSKMLYGGGVNNSSSSGMLIGNSGGKITLENCELAHGHYDAIFSYAQITAENCALYDCDRGVNAVGGSVTMKNCVVDKCRWGVMAEGGAGRFYNCSITRFYGSPSWPTGYGVSLWSGGSLTVKNCNVWTDSASGQNYLRFSGTSCISADPRFVSADAGDFRLLADSPCIDAGDGTVAPATDWFGQTRQTVYDDAKGMPDAKGNYPDIGIHEVMPREVKSDIDLAVESVSAPELLAVGQEMTVSWTVKNLGSETVSGAWVDKVELVCANGAAVEVGRVATSATLPADGSRTFSGTFTVPSAQVGAVRVRVTANANRDIFEGTLTANNVGEMDAATLTMPELAFPDSGVASFNVAAGGSVGYRLGDGFVDGGLLIVHVASATAGRVKVWTGNGQVPTADIFYAAAVEVGGGDYLVRVPEGGDAYVAFANESSGLAKVDVGTETGAFLLFDTGIVTAPNAGTASLTLYGNGFSDDMEVWLVGRGVPAAPQIHATDLAVFDPVKAVATFDVTGLAAGEYEVHVKKGGDEVSASFLSLTETRIGPKWSCKLDIASSVRSSREYVGYLEYANSGDMPLDAPYVKITAGSGSFIRFGTSDAWGDTLELMAVSETYPASQLKPGEKRRIPFRYKTTSSSLSIECGYTQDDKTAFPWDTNAAYMRPSWASDELWGLSLAVLKSNVGATWNDYLARMRANCDHLAKIGQPTYRLDRIWQLEINEALGVDHAVSTLASNTDLARSGRGFGLALSRSYGSGLYRRLRKGIFGYGWSDNYSAYAELQNSGATLALHSGSGSTYLFEKVNGKWTPEDARDKTICTESSSEYVLTYRSGTVQRIAKSNMRVSSVTDNQGNSLTFAYNADKQLVKVEHCDGQSLSFTYAGGLLASATDDQGRTTRYEYSGDLLVKVTAFSGLSTQYRYLPADGSVTSRAISQIRYADGTTRDYTYDGAGRVATVSINGNLQTVEIERGALGSYAVIAPNGGATTVTLGASGEVLETVNALGQKSTRTYTADTLLEAVVGPTGKRAKIAYDEDGQAVKATDAAGANTLFGYTSDFGNLAKVTDARGNSFDYGYDKLGRSKSISYADGSIESIAYNDRGDVTNSVNRRGQSIAFTYDREGNTLSKVWEDGRTFTWAYDAKGNCTNATDSATGTVTMEYDENERLVRIVHPKGRGFAYTYDSLGRTTSRTTLTGGSQLAASAADIQRYEYDSLGRLSRMTDGDGKLYVENAYDPTTGWLITQAYGNGTIVSNAYDILGRTIGIYYGRAVSMKPPYLAFFEYEYDVEGRRISQATAEGVERYTYDIVGQLTDVIYPDDSEEHFTYDAVGNRIAHTGTTGILPVDETYTANNLNQYTTIAGGSPSSATECTYDLDGNLTSKTSPDGTTLYYYDIQNRLVAVTNTTKDIAWSCEYNVFGNRTKVMDHGTAKETLFVQGSLASAVADYDASGSLTTRHILLGSVRLADISGTGGSPVQTSYYHADGLASTRLLTDANGDTIGTASYRAFGEVRTGGSPSSATTPSAGWVGTLGVERDGATGLVFMRNRYYDTEQGRFIQMDPIKHKGGDVNLYRYCANKPNAATDPKGTEIGCKSSRVQTTNSNNPFGNNNYNNNNNNNNKHGCKSGTHWDDDLRKCVDDDNNGGGGQVPVEEPIFNGDEIFNGDGVGLKGGGGGVVASVGNWVGDHPYLTGTILVGGAIAVDVVATKGQVTRFVVMQVLPKLAPAFAY